MNEVHWGPPEMKNPVVLHVVRPYADEREYLAAEAWTIDDRGMFLIDDHLLAPDTTVVFDIALANGIKVIRAEGRVERQVPAEGNHPAGLRVRFRRFGAQTKAFIDRALGHAERRAAAPATQRSASMAPISVRGAALAGPSSVRGDSLPPSSVRGDALPPDSTSPRSVIPPPLPPRGSRPSSAPESERAPLSTRSVAPGSLRPPLPPSRRSLTPPAGTPLPYETMPPASTRARPAPAEPPRARAEAEPILPAIVPPSRATAPGLGSEPVPPPPAPPSSVSAPFSRSSDLEPSGIHALQAELLARPKNRDELLARLRERSKGPESSELAASARLSRPEGSGG